MKNNKIQVGPFKYSVIFDQKKLQEQAAVNEELVGFCDHHNQRLIIDDTQAPQMLKETVFHEFLHACFFASGLSSRLSYSAEEDLEEWIVSSLSPILFDSFLRNHKFFQELTE